MQHNYATEGAYKTYIDYLALKRHFTSNYDYHQYGGKVKASFESFQTRKDVFFFYKLSQKKHAHDMLLANMVKKPDAWVGDILEEVGEEIYLAWKKKIDSLSYQFQQDLGKLNFDFRSNFTCNDGQHPTVLSLLLQQKISLETFTILGTITNSFDMWESSIEDKFIAGGKINLAKKYFPFLSVDRKIYSEIVKKKFF